MKIKYITKLDEQLTCELQELIKKCQLNDGTSREPYLSNILNFDQSMPAFFIALENGVAIGLLTVYADTRESVTLTINVEPHHRRRGYARLLFQAYKEVATAFQVHQPLFQTEAVFLQNNSDFVKNSKLIQIEDSELWMARDRVRYDLEEHSQWVVAKAEITHIDAIAEFQSIVFEIPLELGVTYAREAIEDKNSYLYILSVDNKVIASCNIDFSSSYNYMYALAVLEEYRGRGIGSYLIKSVVNDLILQNEKKFQIAVDRTNTRARQLYEKLGFNDQTEVIFLRENI